MIDLEVEFDDGPPRLWRQLQIRHRAEVSNYPAFIHTDRYTLSNADDMYNVAGTAPAAPPMQSGITHPMIGVPSSAIVRSAGSLWALFFGMALMMVAHGLQGSLLGVRADAEGFPSAVIGLVMASYFLGFLAGSRLTTTFLRRVGHVRVFAAMASLASIAVLVHMLVVTPWVWFLMRLLSGIAYAGLYIVVESWLNDRADNANRAGLLSIYVIIAYASMAGGQLLLNVADPGTHILFALVSILVSFSLVPILLSASDQPESPGAERFGLRELFQLSPLGTVGAFLAGMGRGAFFGMGAVYASQADFTIAEISLFMLLGIAGGALFQWPVGRLSDRGDRRWVIVGMAAAAALAAVGLAFIARPGWPFFGLVIVLGGTMLPLYPLFNAHLNDYLQPQQVVAAGSSMIFLQGIGAILGPLLAGWLMGMFSPTAFLLYIAVMHAAVVAFTLYRLGHVARRRRTHWRYQPVPAHSPVSVFRNDADEPALDDAPGGEDGKRG